MVNKPGIAILGTRSKRKVPRRWPFPARLLSASDTIASLWSYLTVCAPANMGCDRNWNSLRRARRRMMTISLAVVWRRDREAGLSSTAHICCPRKTRSRLVRVRCIWKTRHRSKFSRHHRWVPRPPVTSGFDWTHPRHFSLVLNTETSHSKPPVAHTVILCVHHLPLLAIDTHCQCQKAHLTTNVILCGRHFPLLAIEAHCQCQKKPLTASVILCGGHLPLLATEAHFQCEICVFSLVLCVLACLVCPRRLVQVSAIVPLVFRGLRIVCSEPRS